MSTFWDDIAALEAMYGAEAFHTFPITNEANFLEIHIPLQMPQARVEITLLGQEVIGTVEHLPPFQLELNHDGERWNTDIAKLTNMFLSRSELGILDEEVLKSEMFDGEMVAICAQLESGWFDTLQNSPEFVDTLKHQKHRS